MQVNRLLVKLITVVLLAAASAVAQTAQAPAQSAGGVSASGPKYTVVRSMAGTSGTESNGKLVIDDPQTIFHLGHDQKVIVYFEWKGPIGPHKFEGLWKNPEGRVVLVSDFQYAATTDEFAGYWTMLLSSSEATGIWTLEARIDGEAAGSFPFQLVTSPALRHQRLRRRNSPCPLAIFTSTRSPRRSTWTNRSRKAKPSAAHLDFSSTMGDLLPRSKILTAHRNFASFIRMAIHN